MPALEQQLGDLADVRRGRIVQVSGATDDGDEEVEVVDERWVIDDFER